MADWKVYQSCYSNTAATGADGVTRNGWRSVAVSPNMPPDMRDECRRYQHKLIPEQPQEQDENGNQLRLYQIIGGDRGIYVLRTLYGLADPSGRNNNMFSHAFAFESGQVQEYPNAFLNLAPENFKDSQEAAEAWDGETLVRLPDMAGREAALRYWGGAETAQTPGSDIPEVVRARWTALVECVYGQQAAQQFRRNANVPPLYIQYKGDEEALRVLLTALYAMLPFNLRRSLKLSTCTDLPNVLTGLNLVFTQKLPDSPRPEYWLDAFTGENSILNSPQIRARVGRIRYVNYAVRNLDLTKTANYFRSLERYVRALGDLSASDESLLKIVHISYLSRLMNPLPDVEVRLEDPILNQENVSDGDLQALLSDILRRKMAVQEEAVDRLLGDVLTEAYCRDMTLTDAMREELRHRAEATRSEGLREAFKAYSAGKKSGDAAAGPAADELENPEVITEEYRGENPAKNTGEGPAPTGAAGFPKTALLGVDTRNRANADGSIPIERWVDTYIDNNPPSTWKLFTDAWRQYLDYADRDRNLNKSRDMIKEQISQRAYRELYLPFATPGGPALNALESYKNLLKVLEYHRETSQNSTPDNVRSQYDDLVDQAKQAYWDKMTPELFRFEEAEGEYKTFAIHSTNGPNTARCPDTVYRDLAGLTRWYNKKQPQNLASFVQKFFEDHRDMFPEAAQRTIVSKLRNYLQKQGNKNIHDNYLENCVKPDTPTVRRDIPPGKTPNPDNAPPRQGKSRYLPDIGTFFEWLCTKYLLTPKEFDSEEFLKTFYAYKNDVENKTTNGIYSQADTKAFMENARAYMLGVAVACDVQVTVSLDVWLEISDGYFEIFRKVNARILDTKSESPELVVQESKLLAIPRYRNNARDFLRNTDTGLFSKDEVAKTVQKWLNAVEKLRPRDTKNF